MFDSIESQAHFENAMREVFGATYRGVPVPPEFRIEWGKELTPARAWRKGVDDAKARERTKVMTETTQ